MARLRGKYKRYYTRKEKEIRKLKHNFSKNSNLMHKNQLSEIVYYSMCINYKICRHSKSRARRICTKRLYKDSYYGYLYNFIKDNLNDFFHLHNYYYYKFTDFGKSRVLLQLSHLNTAIFRRPMINFFCNVKPNYLKSLKRKGEDYRI